MDEPTSALDPELVQEVREVIRALARSGTTMIVVTHEISLAREIADDVVFMSDGVIVEQGSAEAMFQAPRQAALRSFIRRLDTR
jgi:ABC-type polar amino acid transport system ATPase subunit